MKRMLIVTAVVALSGVVPLIAGAQFAIPGGADPINQYISKLYMFGIGIGGILAVLMIVIGGIYYSVSGAVDKKSEGKEMITSALLGLLILFGSYLILNTVNPVLTTLKNPTLPPGLISTSTLQYSCTSQNTSRGCTATESPIDSRGRCVCYRVTLGACAPEAFLQCPSAPIVKGPNEEMAIPACALKVTAMDPAMNFFFSLLNLSIGSCGSGFDFKTAKPTTAAEYYRYPFYPITLGSSEQQCVVYAIRISDSGRIVRPNMEGLQKCEPQR